MSFLGQVVRMLNLRHGGLSVRFQTAGRMLLWLTAVLLAVMPLTERFGRFDNFQHGGPDFELSMLALLSLLCLVLLLGHGSKLTLFALLTRRCLVSLAFGTAPGPQRRAARNEAPWMGSPGGGSAATAALQVPLLI